MLTEEGPRVLEFNARFGDPETQAILPLLRGDLLPALYACATGTLSPDMLDWNEDLHAACVVVASPGYPDATRTGAPIRGLESAADENVLVFHAGTTWKDSQIVTSGGRVLGVTGLGSSLQSALERAYNALDTIDTAGMQLRRDIGRNAEGPLL
jgi:phosphoribosylamine--glycine ligase